MNHIYLMVLSYTSEKIGWKGRRCDVGKVCQNNVEQSVDIFQTAYIQ